MKIFLHYYSIHIFIGLGVVNWIKYLCIFCCNVNGTSITQETNKNKFIEILHISYITIDLKMYQE